MTKRWTKSLLIAAIVVLFLGSGARLLMGTIVGSVEFKELANRILERSVEQVLPGAMVEMDGVELTGLARINVVNILVRSGVKPDITVSVPLVQLSPRFWPLLSSGLLVFDVEMALLDGGRAMGQVAAPLGWVLSRKSQTAAEDEPYVALEGTLEGISIPPFFDLIMAGDQRPGFRLTSGQITGRVAMRKPVGASRASGRKLGRIDFQVLTPRWEILAADGAKRELIPANFDVSLEMQDFAIVLREPLVFQDRDERAVVRGTLVLPKYADSDLTWDLIVQAEGSRHAEHGLARLLRCKTLPVGSPFSVKGPVSGPRCAS